jgi:hypothetical protein
LEDPNIDEMILKGSSGSGMVRGMYWIGLAEDGDRWQVLVNA